MYLNFNITLRLLLLAHTSFGDFLDSFPVMMSRLRRLIFNYNISGLTVVSYHHVLNDFKFSSLNMRSLPPSITFAGTIVAEFYVIP